MPSYRPLRYTLRQLSYFAVTADVLSFTAASKLLHVSQPSISTALAELESSFGVQLFVRLGCLASLAPPVLPTIVASFIAPVRECRIRHTRG